MKRFLLFVYSGGLRPPNGGWADFRKDFDTVVEALNYYRNGPNKQGDAGSSYQVVDLQNGSVVDHNDLDNAHLFGTD